MEIDLKPDDIRIDSYSSAASSGFSFRVARGVRVTHIPTGLSVTCESERSQHRNKAIAIEKLKEKLNHGSSGELSMTNLLPCPFCGRDPKVSHRTASDEGLHAGGYVAFISCACGTYSAKAHQSGGGNTVEEAIDSASKKWNTRVKI